jgi:hypothetical protein
MKLEVQLIMALGTTVAFAVCAAIGYAVVLSGNRGNINWAWAGVMFMAVFVASFAAIGTIWEKLPH